MKVNTDVHGGDKRVRDSNDSYPTPIPLVNFALSLPPHPLPGVLSSVLDVGAGRGVWGMVCKEIYPLCLLFGVEIQKSVTPDKAYDTWISNNFLTTDFGKRRFDLIMGNPPYGMVEGVKDRKIVEKFVDKSIGLLSLKGTLILLLKLSFLESISRKEGIFAKNPPVAAHVSSRRIPYQSERGGGAAMYSHGIFVWKKRNPGKHTSLHWFDWKDYHTGSNLWKKEDV